MVEFYAAPTVSGDVIIGVTPSIPYTPEKFEEVKELYEQRLREHKELEESMKTKQVEVTSNSDAEKKYLVTVYSSDNLECSCRGFEFRGTCSHIDQVKESL